MPWARLASFPSACPAGQYASAVGSSLTCSAPAGGIGGSGTANYLPKWTAGTALGNSVIYDNGNVGIGTTTPGAKLDVNGSIGSQTLVLTPQSTPPLSPVKGQLYFDANANAFKFYDGANWKFLDSGYMSGLIDYTGATHTRKQCTDAGGVVTSISGDGTNTEVCKFTASSCVGGWTQAGNWHSRKSSTNPTCDTGGDVCGSFKDTCCTIPSVSWSNTSNPSKSCDYTSYAQGGAYSGCQIPCSFWVARPQYGWVIGDESCYKSTGLNSYSHTYTVTDADVVTSIGCY